MADLIFTDQNDDTHVGSLVENTEFIPIVEFSSEENPEEYICESETHCKRNPIDEPIFLSAVNDEYAEYHISKVSFKNKGVIKLNFSIKKGCEKSVNIGCITTQLSPYTGEKMKLINSSEKNELIFENIEISTDSQLSLEVEVKEESNQVHHLTFYSYDDKMSNLGRKICGQIRLIFPLCVCYEWENKDSVILAGDFIGWDEAKYRKPKMVNGVQTKDKDGIPETVPWQCYDYAKEQMRLAGYNIVGWDEAYITGKNKKIFQLYIDNTQKNIKGLNSFDEFNPGIQYIKDSIKDSIPVFVGIDYSRTSYPKGQGDKTTDHFVVIVGMGTDETGRYFTFFDNGTKAYGADVSLNKLYVNCESSELGTSDEKYTDGKFKDKFKYPAFQYARLLRDPNKGFNNTFIVSQIRKSTKIKK